MHQYCELYYNWTATPSSTALYIYNGKYSQFWNSLQLITQYTIKLYPPIHYFFFIRAQCSNWKLWRITHTCIHIRVALMETKFLRLALEYYMHSIDTYIYYIFGINQYLRWKHHAKRAFCTIRWVTWKRKMPHKHKIYK